MKKLICVKLFLGICCLLGNPVFGQQKQAFEFVVEPYLIDLNSNSFQVMWETSEAARGEVYFAKSTYDILSPEFKVISSDRSHKVLHHHTITGLNANDLYFYQVVNVNQSGDTLKGPVTQVTTSYYNQSPVSFSVVGDTQGNPVVWGKIVELMEQERPQFIVHVGDLVQYGPNKDDWRDEFFHPATKLLRYTPLYPAAGNHEMNDEKLYQYFNLPEGNAFYTITKGDVRLIFVDTNKDVLPGSAQYRKLENLLAITNEPWKIVVHHHPLFTSDKYSYRSSLRATPTKGDPNLFHLNNLYETYGVDLTLSGHVHNYERTWPIFKNHVDLENGVTHIVTGGGGGSFKKTPNDINWFSVEAKNVYHFLNVRIQGRKLFVEAIDTTGKVFDFWEKEKVAEKTNLLSPLISSTNKYFIDSTTVTIENINEGGLISFRLNDGLYQSVVTKKKSVNVDNTTTISAMVNGVNNGSREAVKTVVKLPVMPKQKSAKKEVRADYYEGYFTELPDFDALHPTNSFSLDSLTLTGVVPRAKDHFAVRFKGSFEVPETDVYRFFLESYDGSRLIIDGKEIIDNDGVHYEISKENYVALEKGIHHFEVQYFDFTRRETLNLLVGKQDNKMVDFNSLIKYPK
ncbi:metallophosphoesterase [Mariniphaga sediminis]|uniref:metallophosphoesterase n=1 Tax=Mariniphaga sediminis TaxID=1628158 RepID=UPI00356214DF